MNINNIKKPVIMILCLFLVSVLMVVLSGLVCNVWSIIKIKTVFGNTLSELGDNWGSVSGDTSFPAINISEPFTINARASVSANASADITASYMPKIKRLSAQAFFENNSGSNADLYAYCTPKSAGVSLAGNGTTFYTFPASTFKNIMGSISASVVSAYNENLTVNNIKTFLLGITERSESGINQKAIAEAFTQLCSQIEWGRCTVFDLLSKNSSYSFQIASKHINKFLATLSKNGVSGYKYVDEELGKYINGIASNITDGYYQFTIMTSGDRINSISCITPEISGTQYNISFKLEWNNKTIRADVTDINAKSRICRADIKKTDDGFKVYAEDFIGKNTFGISAKSNNDDSVLTADFKIDGYENISVEVAEVNDGYSLSLFFDDAKNSSAALTVRFEQSYEEMCDVAESCSLFEANAVELWRFNKQLNELRKTAGI